MSKYIYWEDEWNEHDCSPIPIRKSKRFKNEIKKYINDDHQYVRTEAVLSYMLLDEKNPFGFLRELKYSFVRWDSLSIYYTMYFNGIDGVSI